MPWCPNVQRNKFYQPDSTCAGRTDCFNAYMATAFGHFWKYHLLLNKTPFLRTLFSCKILKIPLFRWKCLLVTHNPLKYADHVVNFICILIDISLGINCLPSRIIQPHLCRLILALGWGRRWAVRWLQFYCFRIWDFSALTFLCSSTLFSNHGQYEIEIDLLNQVHPIQHWFIFCNYSIYDL